MATGEDRERCIGIMLSPCGIIWVPDATSTHSGRSDGKRPSRVSNKETGDPRTNDGELAAGDAQSGAAELGTLELVGVSRRRDGGWGQMTSSAPRRMSSVPLVLGWTSWPRFTEDPLRYRAVLVSHMAWDKKAKALDCMFLPLGVLSDVIPGRCVEEGVTSAIR